MTLNINSQGRGYFQELGIPSDPGVRLHWKMTGVVLSWLDLSFKDNGGTWVNKNSAAKYLVNNKSKLFTEPSQNGENCTISSDVKVVESLFKKAQATLLGHPTAAENSGNVEIHDSSSLPSTPLEKTSKRVYDMRIKLYLEAKKENSDPIQTNYIFINKIRDEFKKDNLSLSQIANDRNAIDIFFNSSILRPALVTYAKVNSLEAISDKHLIYLASNIYNKRQSYAGRINRQDNVEKQLFEIMNLVRDACKLEGRSLNDILKNEEAKNILMKSSTLSLVILLYVKLQTPQTGPSSAPPTDNNLERIKVKAAKEEGQAHAQNIGYVTKLGMPEFLGDEDQLRKAARAFLLKNHPDKNPDSDLEQVKAANNLLNLIRDGNFPVYRKALEDGRN